jgi:hypothetical protein
MSTDVLPAGHGRGAGRRARGWRRSVLATVGILSVAVAGLGLAGTFRAPHLDDASVAAATALLRPDQRLVLQADQEIEPVEASDVRISPATPIEVSADGRAVTVRFPGMLRALTEYTVSVDVRGASTGVAGSWEYAFTTPDLDVAVLVRDLERPDEVVRRAVSGDDPEVLFRADRIQEFALTPDGVAAIVLDESATGPAAAAGRVVLAPEGETITQEISLPGEGRLQQLHASETTGRIGFTFSSTDTRDPEAVSSRLLLFDPLDPSGVVRPVTGLDGEPVSVIDWMFVPGTPYLVAHTFGEAVLLVDTSDPEAVPAPLGEHAELRGFLPGTLRLVVADPLSGGLLDLRDGGTSEFTPPDDGLEEGVYRGALLALTEDRYVEVVSRPSGDSGFVLDYEVLLVDEEGAVTIYDPPEGVPIRAVCLSPNAQFLAVELQDPAGEPDGYPNLPGRTASTTYFVDLETGSANRGIQGFASSWCA